MQPFGGELVNLIGREIENCVVLECGESNSIREDRWSFTSFTPYFFIWLVEISKDNGMT